MIGIVVVLTANTKPLKTTLFAFDNEATFMSSAAASLQLNLTTKVVSLRALLVWHVASRVRRTSVYVVLVGQFHHTTITCSSSR